MVKSFLEEIRPRGLLYQRTAEEALDRHLAESRVGYCGFDPTADSLTIGNLVPIQMLVHWQRAGHAPVALVGGGTGLIGDPSGRDGERPLLTREQVEANVAGQRRIFERLLDFDPKHPNPARILNNADWLCELRLVDFLRDVGKHFSVNAMVQKESVRERLHNRDQGISYTEFSYMLLQSYDFLHLQREIGCSVQMAGSDQYGNITAGIDLIHRTLGHAAPAFGVTAPLVTRSDGKKMGKSADGALWLTADRTSPYAFYQYWLNVPDSDVIRFLRLFSVLEPEEIEALDARHRDAPHEREAHRRLARHMTDRLHGESERRRVETASEALFGRGDVRSLDVATLAEISAEIPRTEHDRSRLVPGVALAEVLAETSLASSRREARELLASGGVLVNGERAAPDRRLESADLLPGGWILLKRGKRLWHATRWGAEAGAAPGC
ncbi:MAG: tyrosine--tRNA ligase [Proteobacteria bacterium]|nr:MAG: tyrosine--tRNA ligase [Pseudomonadota bacterium]